MQTEAAILFDHNIERTRLDGKKPDESDFGYLNVSNRPESAKVRRFLDS